MALSVQIISQGTAQTHNTHTHTHTHIHTHQNMQRTRPSSRYTNSTLPQTDFSLPIYDAVAGGRYHQDTHFNGASGGDTPKTPGRLVLTPSIVFLSLRSVSNALFNAPSYQRPRSLKFFITKPTTPGNHRLLCMESRIWDSEGKGGVQRRVPPIMGFPSPCPSTLPMGIQSMGLHVSNSYTKTHR